MVERYVNHGGRQFDRPVVRFGNLSMLPETLPSATLIPLGATRICSGQRSV